MSNDIQKIFLRLDRKFHNHVDFYKVLRYR